MNAKTYYLLKSRRTGEFFRYSFVQFPSPNQVHWTQFELLAYSYESMTAATCAREVLDLRNEVEIVLSTKSLQRTS